MKTLRSISTAVLLCLVLAAPAAADSIHLSVSPTSTFPGSPVTYTVSGEAEATRHYDVYLLNAETSGVCAKALKNEATPNTTAVATRQVPASGKLETSGPISAALYEVLGTYFVCAAVQTEAPNPIETFASFTVVAPPPPPVVAPTPVPVQVVSPPPAQKVSVASKRKAAAAACKKRYKHNGKKLAQCLKKSKRIR